MGDNDRIRKHVGMGLGVHPHDGGRMSADHKDSAAYQMLVGFYTRHPEGIAIARRWRNQRLMKLGRRVGLGLLICTMVAL